MSDEHKDSSVREAFREQEERLDSDESSKLSGGRPKRGLKRSRSLLQGDKVASSMSSESHVSSEIRSVSLFGGPKTDNTTTSRMSRRSSAPSLASSSSSRSQLFPDENPSLLAPATLLGTNGDSSQTQTTPKTAVGKHTSSLFGAVMKNVESSSSAHQHHPPSTPKQAIKQSSFSPGGFQIRDFINSVNSPFHLPSSGASPASATPLTPRHQVEWHETQVENHSIGILDWTLKSKLQLQGQPGISLSQSAQIRQQGMLRFVSGNNDTEVAETLDPKTASSVQWEAGLLYWQHPAVYPLPSKLRPASVGAVPPLRDVNGADSRTANNSSQHDALAKPSKAAMPPPQRPLLLQPLKIKNESSSFLEQRRREWQEAFGSLYMKWMQAVRNLDETWDEEANEVGGNEVSDTYFYSIGKGHVILFRVGMDSRANSDNGDGPITGLVPEIAISSSTKQSRETLRAMGVKLTLVEGWEGMEGEFREDALCLAPSEASNAAVDASPAVKAELAALRRAQVFGQNVGADVSVSMKAKSRMRFRSPKTIPPLLVSGEDDCAAFFEFYLNTFGQMSVARSQRRIVEEPVHGVPILLCRKLGPFLHSSLKSNRVGKKRDSSVLADSLGYTSIDLQGFILPCAVRQLVSATIDDMYADGKERDHKSDDDSACGDGVGSHHLVVRATTQEFGESLSMPGEVGSPDTTRFNGRNDKGETRTIQNCRYGETMMMAVWDITRPTALAYKLDYTSSTLPG